MLHWVCSRGLDVSDVTVSVMPECIHPLMSKLRLYLLEDAEVYEFWQMRLHNAAAYRKAYRAQKKLKRTLARGSTNRVSPSSDVATAPNTSSSSETQNAPPSINSSSNSKTQMAPSSSSSTGTNPSSIALNSKTVAVPPPPKEPS